MNMNFKLNLNEIKKLWPVLKQLAPVMFGVALIGLFGYTAWVVNSALNVKPAIVVESGQTGGQASTKIKFDQATVEAVKNLNVVNGDVPVGALGKDDPFK